MILWLAWLSWLWISIRSIVFGLIVPKIASCCNVFYFFTNLTLYVLKLLRFIGINFSILCCGIRRLRKGRFVSIICEILRSWVSLVWWVRLMITRGCKFNMFYIIGINHFWVNEIHGFSLPLIHTHSSEMFIKRYHTFLACDIFHKWGVIGIETTNNIEHLLSIENYTSNNHYMIQQIIFHTDIFLHRFGSFSKRLKSLG